MTDVNVDDERKGEVKQKSKSFSHHPYYKQVKLIIVGLIVGTFSIFAASSFRDLVEAILQVATPLGSHSLAGGSVLVAYRVCYFLIILSIVIAIGIIFV